MKTMLADATVVTGWQQSRRCDNSGPNCVQAAPYNGGVAVRNSTNPSGPALLFTAQEWTVFLAGAKDGEFDGLTGL